MKLLLVALVGLCLINSVAWLVYTHAPFVAAGWFVIGVGSPWLFGRYQ